MYDHKPSILSIKEKILKTLRKFAYLEVKFNPITLSLIHFNNEMYRIKFYEKFTTNHLLFSKITKASDSILQSFTKYKTNFLSQTSHVQGSEHNAMRETLGSVLQPQRHIMLFIRRAPGVTP